MPLINYHSARMIDPKRFKHYAYKRMGKGIDYVFGIDEKHQIDEVDFDNIEEASHVQAIRFNKKLWSTSAAKAWLKKNGKNYISFHPAVKSSVKEDAGPASSPSTGPASIPTVATTTADLSPYYAMKMQPMVSRQGDRFKKKRTLKETLEMIVDGKTNIC